MYLCSKFNQMEKNYLISKLIEIREKLNLSTSEFERFGISRQTLHNFEEGVNSSVDTLFAYINVLYGFAGFVLLVKQTDKDGKTKITGLVEKDKLGVLLSKIRHNDGLSMRQMFLKTGIRDTKVSAVEFGRGYRMSTLEKYLNALDTKVEFDIVMA